MKKVFTTIMTGLAEAEAAAKKAEADKRKAKRKSVAVTAAKKKKSPSPATAATPKASGTTTTTTTTTATTTAAKKNAPVQLPAEIAQLTSSSSSPMSPSMARNTSLPASPSRKVTTLDQELISSTKGVWETFTQLKSQLPSALQFPQLVALGAESAGKSTLLERLLGLAVLPRADGIVTLSPVELRLINDPKESLFVGFIEGGVDKDRQAASAGKVKEFIQTHFNSLDRSSIPSNGRSVFVEIHGPNRPNLTLIDLPGLVAYPPANLAATRQIAEQYLRKKDVLVVCVVPATTPSLLSTPALELIHTHQKKSQTLLALTRADEVPPSQFATRVVTPLTATTGDIAQEFSKYGIFATASVPMGSGDDLNGLTEAEDGLFRSALDASGTTGAEDIQSRTGVAALQRGIISMYLDYVKNSWIQTSITHLESAVLPSLEASVQNLGADPLSMSGDEQKAWVADELKDLFISLGKVFYTDSLLEKLFNEACNVHNSPSDLETRLRSIFDPQGTQGSVVMTMLSHKDRASSQLTHLVDGVNNNTFIDHVRVLLGYQGSLTRFPGIVGRVEELVLNVAKAQLPNLKLVSLEAFHASNFRPHFLGHFCLPILTEISKFCDKDGVQKFIEQQLSLPGDLEDDTTEPARAKLRAEMADIKAGISVLKEFEV